MTMSIPPSDETAPPAWNPDATAPDAAQPSGLAPVTTPVVKSRAHANLTTYLLAAGLLVAAAGVAFAVGRVSAPTAQAGARGTGQFGTGGGAGGTAGGGQGRGFGLGGGILTLRGTVSATDGQTITLQLANGQTVKIGLTGSTTYHKATSGTASDVTSGGSLAVEVQTPRFGGGGGQGANPSPTPSGAITLSATDVTVLNP